MAMSDYLTQTQPRQRLPRDAYISDAWYRREQQGLLSNTWRFVGITHDFKQTGDYRCVQTGVFNLVVMQGESGEIRAFHNHCEHRGTELLEGSGCVQGQIVCPYHHWSYDLDGSLRSVPAQKQCFPELDKNAIRLKTASVGVFRDLIFVHPSDQPPLPFEKWLGGLGDVAWPHDMSDNSMVESDKTLVYEIQCNWKVFLENAIDGYHLAFLHRNTLGGPIPTRNEWQIFNQHMVWWSTERPQGRHPVPRFVERAMEQAGVKSVKGLGSDFGGVYVLFPLTIVTPSPWGLAISWLEPQSAHVTLLKARTWTAKSWWSYKERPEDAPGFDQATGLIKSSHWKTHPLQSGDFQTEDIWVCEKMQRSLQSPAYEVTALARGAGGEAMLEFFQNCVLEHMS
jgi:choline monooxygenase